MMQGLYRRTHNVLRSLRRGNVIVLSAFLMIPILAFAAFTVDLGYVCLAKAQLQNAVDAATLAGVTELNPQLDQTTVAANVRQAVVEVAGLHRVANQAGLYINPNQDVELGRRDWNGATQSFAFEFGPAAVPYNLVRVTGRLTETTDGGNPPQTVDRRLPLFFAPVLGSQRSNLLVTSTATFQPRDLMLVLDYSGSMNDDTEFKAIPGIAQATVTNAITQMWHELGDPTYGDMPFTPTYLVARGVAASGTIPHIDLTYRGSLVDVTSTLPLTQVKLKLANGNVVAFAGLTQSSGTFNGGGRVKQVWVQSGTNATLSTEGWGERFNFNDQDIVNWLGLGTVAYPYPAGSWVDFVDYVNSSSYVNTAGFRYKYGTIGLINYWNEQKALVSQTPGLWVCSTQPLTLLKNSMDSLIDFVADVEADDQIGLVIYSHSNADGAILESGLSSNLNSIKTLYRQRQAGHYQASTNIGGGLHVARLELQAHARPQTFRMILLVTDGVPNLPSANPAQYVVDEANACKAAKIRIMTVSVGLGADTNLMQEVADLTGGMHFNVPGGASFADYQAQLTAVFQQIASERPLKLLPATTPP